MKTVKKVPNTRTRRAIRTGLTVVGTLLLLTGFLCLFAAWWYLRTYGNTGFDSILFTLTSSLGGVESDLILSFLTGAGLPCLLCTAVAATLIFQPRNGASGSIP